MKDRHDSKKLDRIKNSVKGKKEYRVLIRSAESFGSIQTAFASGDLKVKVRRVGGNAYMVNLPIGSSAFPEELRKIDNGILPSSIGDYDVVAPEIFEATGTDYLIGEETGKLWGLEKI